MSDEKVEQNKAKLEKKDDTNNGSTEDVSEIGECKRTKNFRKDNKGDDDGWGAAKEDDNNEWSPNGDSAWGQAPNPDVVEIKDDWKPTEDVRENLEGRKRRGDDKEDFRNKKREYYTDRRDERSMDEYRRDDYRREERFRDDYKRDNKPRDDYKRDEIPRDDYRRDDDYRREDRYRDDYRRDFRREGGFNERRELPRDSIRGVDKGYERDRHYGRDFERKRDLYREERGRDTFRDERSIDGYRDPYRDERRDVYREDRHDLYASDRRDGYRDSYRDSYRRDYDTRRPPYEDGSRTRPTNTTRRRGEASPHKIVGMFGLSIYATQQDIEDFLLEKIPSLRNYSIELVKSRDDPSISRGFCFVKFLTLEDAKVAMENLKNCNIKGKEIRVEYAFKVNPRVY